MRSKTIDRLVGAGVFLYALVLYGLTVAPTTSFWDAGEFIAIANRLEVSHPPGAPFFMLLGRIFSMWVPAEYVALATNLISVLASAGAVLLTHLVIVRLIRRWRGTPETWDAADRWIALGGGAIGAATFAATDSFWFNAVETEMYALSLFFTALVVWLIMKWSEQVRETEAARRRGAGYSFGLKTDRYLVLIAYMFGLATGVHLLNLLAIFYCGLIVYFVRFDDPEWEWKKTARGILAAGLVSSAAFLVVYPGIIQMLPSWAGRFGSPFVFGVLLIGAVLFALYYTRKKRWQVAHMAVLCVTVVLIGYSSYSIIFIRSAADPPIDENDPETAESIVSYLEREQYGATPLLRGATYDDQTGQISQDEITWFPRRHSTNPRHLRVYSRYDSDWSFFWQYQVGHMYVRYFMWNFVGKAKDNQDSGWITGLSARETESYIYSTPSERASRNAYYGLPLLLGLFGLMFHFSQDWRRAFTVGVLFLVTGLGIVLYLNQTPLQPRERHYSYVASFFAFSLWIGIGASGLIELAYDAVRERLEKSRPALWAAGLMTAVVFLGVPGLMAQENYADHDRSGRYIARDYAWNMLQSVEENAIIFTNGDNDTFPLWYLQEVEGIRRDVRVVNLSLLNTTWYIKQLKNQWAREAPPVPISYSEERIENQMGVARWNPRRVSLPVPEQEVAQRFAEYLPRPSDTSMVQSPMSWKLQGRQYNQDTNILWIADQVVLDIVVQNARDGWKRPIYFAITTSPGGQIDLQNYFHLEGMAYRLLPIRHDRPQGRIVPDVMRARTDTFRFGNLDDPDVYYDNVIRRMVDNYRTIYAQLAESLSRQGRNQEARAVLDGIMEEVPLETIPGNPSSLAMLARSYDRAGDTSRVAELMSAAEPLVLNRLRTAQSSQQRQRAAQYVQMVQYNYIQAGDYASASDFTHRLARVLGDSTFRQSPRELQKMYGSPGGVDGGLPAQPGGGAPPPPTDAPPAGQTAPSGP